MHMASKLQSAMEYLMTYGWAILIIAIVLGVLYYLGVFSPQVINGCVAQPDYLCQQLVFNANVANLYGDPSVSVNLGVASTQPWSNVYFTIVPEGQQITDTTLADEANANDIFYWGQLYGQYYFTPSLAQGQIATAKMYISTNYPGISSTTPILGTKLVGSIWAMYTTASTTNALVQVAVFSTVATRNN